MVLTPFSQTSPGPSSFRQTTDRSQSVNRFMSRGTVSVPNNWPSMLQIATDWSTEAVRMVFSLLCEMLLTAMLWARQDSRI